MATEAETVTPAAMAAAKANSGVELASACRKESTGA
jgi:hypothetical protein